MGLANVKALNMASFRINLQHIETGERYYRSSRAWKRVTTKLLAFPTIHNNRIILNLLQTICRHCFSYYTLQVFKEVCWGMD